MKNKQSLMRKAVTGFFMLLPAVAFADAGTADQILNQTHLQLRNMSGSIVNVVSVIMGLIGVVMLATNLVKYFKVDPSSNDALMKVGGGLLIAVVILQIIRVTLLAG